MIFPIVAVDDLESVVRFYCEVLGFEVTYRFEDVFAVVSRDGSDVGLAQRAPGGNEFELCLYVDDVDETVARMAAAGARIAKPPEDMPWGERMAYVEPPGGTLLHVAAKIAP